MSEVWLTRREIRRTPILGERRLAAQGYLAPR
jgi:hypothetical protein